MLTNYLILELSPDASDEEIRKHYLQKVKRYSPEREPEMFRRITLAYEGLKDKRNRVRGEVFGGLSAQDYDSALRSLADARTLKRRRAGLGELMKAEKTE